MLTSVDAADRERRAPSVVILRSTVLPHVVEGELVPLLERAFGKRLGEDLNLCYNQRKAKFNVSQHAYRGLHLGSFNQPLDGWLNTDITPHIFLARFPWTAHILFYAGKMPRERLAEHQRGVFRRVRYLNVCKRFPFRDSTFPAVFSSHMLEHLSPSVAHQCLMESYRVLQPNGICRVVIPDLDKLIASYSPQHPDDFLESFYYDGSSNPKNRHHWYYNEKSLIALLRKTGFREAYRCTYRQGRCPDLEKLDNRPESLFVEAIK